MSEIIEVKLVNAEVTTLRLEPGDVVLVKADTELRREQQLALSKAIQPYFPKNKVVVHGNDFEISTVKADQQGEDVLRYCPECGSRDIATTTDVSPPSKAWCGCGWEGSGSKLLPEPPLDAILSRLRKCEQWISNQDSQNK